MKNTIHDVFKPAFKMNSFVAVLSSGVITNLLKLAIHFTRRSESDSKLGLEAVNLKPSLSCGL